MDQRTSNHTVFCFTAIMAEAATPSAVAISTMDAGSDPIAKPQRTRPEKPDEAAYKIGLSEAEKAHTAAQQKLVPTLSSL